jgi:hypothetical protein
VKVKVGADLVCTVVPVPLRAVHLTTTELFAGPLTQARTVQSAPEGTERNESGSSLMPAEPVVVTFRVMAAAYEPVWTFADCFVTAMAVPAKAAQPMVLPFSKPGLDTAAFA